MLPIEIEQTIRRFVIDTLLFGQEGAPISTGDSFLEKGMVDSTSVLEIVAFLEDHYHITVEDDEMVPANLDSLGNLVNYVERKLRG